jgi:Sodium/hydrogen exchanger family
MVAFVALAESVGLEVILGAFAAGALLSLIDRDRMMTHPQFRTKLEAAGFGIFIPVFFVTTGLRFDLDALFASAGTVARIPLFLLALLVVRGLPALLYTRLVGRRKAVIAGMLQATSLPFIVAAAQIGMDIGVLTEANGAALIAAGLLSVIIFPTLAPTAATRAQAGRAGADAHAWNAGGPGRDALTRPTTVLSVRAAKLPPPRAVADSPWSQLAHGDQLLRRAAVELAAAVRAPVRESSSPRRRRGGAPVGPGLRHLVGGLLGDEVADTRDDHPIHVVRDRLHRLSDVFTEACLSADREDGPRQPLGLALLVARWLYRARPVRRGSADRGRGGPRAAELAYFAAMYRLDANATLVSFGALGHGIARDERAAQLVAEAERWR